METVTKSTNHELPKSSQIKFTSTEAKFINYIMKCGKKTLAKKIFLNAMDVVKGRKKDENPHKIFEKAIENIKPAMEVRPKRVGGAIYQIPREVPARRQIMLSFRWILQAAQGRKGAEMGKKLADEILEAYNNSGFAIKKKDETHRMAQANKAFAHLARY
jgi:small subunit ribosomal protein S7